MEHMSIPPPDHESLAHEHESESRLHVLQERFRGLTFNDLRAYCLEHTPTATVGLFVLAEKRYPADVNPEAKYLMLVDLLISLAALHEVSVEEEVRTLEAAFNMPSATDPDSVPPEELTVQPEI